MELPGVASEAELDAQTSKKSGNDVTTPSWMWIIIHTHYRLEVIVHRVACYFGPPEPGVS